MAGFPDRERLDALAERIRAAESMPKPVDGKTPTAEEVKSYRMGRLGFDFCATVIVFVVVGWFADRQFGSRPWILLAMTITGFAAGIMNVWRGLGSFNPGQRPKDGK